MGWDETYAISATHGRGTGDLLDAIVWNLLTDTHRDRSVAGVHAAILMSAPLAEAL